MLFLCSKTWGAWNYQQREFHLNLRVATLSIINQLNLAGFDRRNSRKVTIDQHLTDQHNVHTCGQVCMTMQNINLMTMFLYFPCSIMLTNYLAAAGDNHELEAGMSISPPWNVFESAVSLERPIDTMLFNRVLTYYLIKSVRG